MKNILSILLIFILIGCNSEKNVISSDQMGKHVFQIINSLDESTYKEFRQHFLTRNELIEILEDSKFLGEKQTNELYNKILNWSEYEYDYKNLIDKESFEVMKKYINSLKKLGRFQFNKFEVEKIIDEVELHTGEMELTFIGGPDDGETDRIKCVFIIYNDIYYLIGFNN
mgnify:FL=1